MIVISQNSVLTTADSISLKRHRCLYQDFSSSIYLIIFFLYLFSVLQPVSYSNKTIVLAASHLLIHETLFLFMLSFLSYFPSLYIFFIHFKIILRITYYAIGCLEVSLRFFSSSQCV